MINKKLDNIQEELNVIKQLMNDKKYIDGIDKGLEYANKRLVELQDRINKAIEYIKEKARNNCWIDQYEANKLIELLKGDNK